MERQPFTRLRLHAYVSVQPHTSIHRRSLCGTGKSPPPPQSLEINVNQCLDLTIKVLIASEAVFSHFYLSLIQENLKKKYLDLLGTVTHVLFRILQISGLIWNHPREHDSLTTRLV